MPNIMQVKFILQPASFICEPAQMKNKKDQMMQTQTLYTLYYIQLHFKHKKDWLLKRNVISSNSQEHQALI